MFVHGGKQFRNRNGNGNDEAEGNESQIYSFRFDESRAFNRLNIFCSGQMLFSYAP